MDSTPRLIDDLRAAGDVTEQVAEVGCQSDPGFRCHFQSFQNRWNRPGSRSLFAGDKLTGCPIQKFQVVQNREREESFVAAAKSRRAEIGADVAVTFVDP